MSNVFFEEASEVDRVESGLEQVIQIMVPPEDSTTNVDSVEGVEPKTKQTKAKTTKGKKQTPWRLESKYDEVLVKLAIICKPYKKFKGKNHVPLYAYIFL